MAERYAELTGLDADYVFASDLRVLDTRFRKRLLLDRSRIVGRYDGRAAGYDLDPVSDDETFVVDDVYLDPAYSAWSMLICATSWAGTASPSGRGSRISTGNPPNRARGGCGGTACPRHQCIEGEIIPFPSVTADLAAAIVHQPTLKVLIGNGWYDLCTPFFQTECDIDHLGLPEPLRGNVAFTYYPAGHMLYSAKESLRKFSSDLKRFYAADAADLPSIDERPALPAPRIDW